MGTMDEVDQRTVAKHLSTMLPGHSREEDMAIIDKLVELVDWTHGQAGFARLTEAA